MQPSLFISRPTPVLVASVFTSHLIRRPALNGLLKCSPIYSLVMARTLAQFLLLLLV